MKRIPSPIRLLIAATVTAAAAAGPVAHVVNAGPNGPDVPDTIAVEPGHKVFLVGHATGVQIYRCDAIAGTYAWTFVAPRADLRDDGGRLVATHFGGPTWQAKDGSRVVAKRAADPVIVDDSAIPWLLLKQDSVAAGSDGERLTATTFIQRTKTTGGLAPEPSTCGASTVGTTQEQQYTADYHFWKKIEG
jgi:hypothetical protein